MKKLLILLFSLLISFNSYGEWEVVSETVNGDTFYIDKDTIKYHGGYVYWWDMGDFVKPYDSFMVEGVMSQKTYSEGDCGQVRYQNLRVISFKEPMGEGDGMDDLNGVWGYPPPDTVDGFILNYVCDYVD